MICGLYALEPRAQGPQLYFGTALMGAAYLLVCQPKKCRRALRVAFREQVEVKARLSLKPIRTFRELDQPASDFIFRVKNGGGFALFEADGGAWKIAAINAIAAWLKNRLHTSEVEQLDTLPIIS
jgi:hypothetical protein